MDPPAAWSQFNWKSHILVGNLVFQCRHSTWSAGMRRIVPLAWSNLGIFNIFSSKLVLWNMDILWGGVVMSFKLLYGSMSIVSCRREAERSSMQTSGSQAWQPAQTRSSYFSGSGSGSGSGCTGRSIWPSGGARGKIHGTGQKRVNQLIPRQSVCLPSEGGQQIETQKIEINFVPLPSFCQFLWSGAGQLYSLWDEAGRAPLILKCVFKFNLDCLSRPSALFQPLHHLLDHLAHLLLLLQVHLGENLGSLNCGFIWRWEKHF